MVNGKIKKLIKNATFFIKIVKNEKSPTRL